MADQKSADKPGRNLGFSERLQGLWRHGFSSQKVFARALDVRDADISSYLNHGVVPRWDTLVQLSEMFGVSVDYLLRGAEAGDARRVNELSPAQQEIICLTETAPPADQQVVVECARVIELGQPDDITALQKDAIGLQLISKLAIDDRAEAPDDPLRRRGGEPSELNSL